ncbi:MAG: hypothetical protein P8M70_08090 [Verrucomicrobiota bacterium]|nr:hypothetical protein [Verrucomicrobiota bacterium]
MAYRNRAGRDLDNGIPIMGRSALGMLLVILHIVAGCKSGAGHSVNAVGRFAAGTLTSGGNPVAGAQNAAIGTVIDVARDPKGKQIEERRPKIVTVYSERRGVQKVIPWKKGITVYSARRAAQLVGSVGKCEIERGDETLPGSFKTVLERGDVLRFQR